MSLPREWSLQVSLPSKHLCVRVCVCVCIFFVFICHHRFCANVAMDFIEFECLHDVRCSREIRLMSNISVCTLAIGFLNLTLFSY